MTRKVCNIPGCGTLAETGNRCPQHAPVDRRGSRGYSTAAWQRARAAYLAEHPYCEHTDYDGYLRIHIHCDDPATEVDHIDGLGPRSPRGTDPTNLKAYCHRHHSRRTGRDHPPGSRLVRGVA